MVDVERMTNEEKVLRVIKMYDEGLDAEEIAPKVGYSHPKSLSRFMRSMNYKWDGRKNNYVLESGALKEKKKADRNEVKKQNVGNEKIDPLDLLEDPKVLSALQQSDIILHLIESQKAQGSTKDQEEVTYKFWKKAQEFAFTRKASFTTSVRLPIQLIERLNDFKETTNLTQTQIICMALDYFMENFESKIS